ncbi:cytochrome b/b6 domain-containing protein [Thiotrichales bacterium 19S3-7]|nr:cytochrome b/b6 domain-containing protein [Thiotrichales bacterium 19S3-7]MCF6801694.1 cytochrome b/b6 domain-containing protein [Thiotrichales bacterium 19S3-11]
MNKYPISMRLLHFLLILIIFAQLTVGYGFDLIFEKLGANTFLILHKSLGLLGLIVVILLILRRLFYTKPPYPNTLSKGQQYLAKLVHLLLYLTVIAMGSSGMLVSMLFNSHWLWFYIIPLPQIISPNPQLGSELFSVHTYGAIVLSLLVALHFLGALYHGVKRDGITKRMF